MIDSIREEVEEVVIDEPQKRTRTFFFLFLLLLSLSLSLLLFSFFSLLEGVRLSHTSARLLFLEPKKRRGLFQVVIIPEIVSKC